MPILRFAPLVLLAGPLYSQSPNNAVRDQSSAILHAVQGIERASLGAGPVRNLGWFEVPSNSHQPESRPAQPTPEAACAIPLLEAPIPNAENFPMRRVQPSVTDRMPATRVLPACPPR